MNAEKYDAIVAGAGGMGSAAIYHLARRGIRACAVERFTIAHDRGSSHGDTRIIRKAYLEHPGYVPLLHRAYELWGQLQAESTEELFAPVGLLLAGDPETDAMRGQAASYREYDLPHETLNAAAVAARYPDFSLPENWDAFYDPLGGLLRVEDCVRRHAELARAHGAVIYEGEVMRSWQSEGTGVVVETERRHLYADRLILAAGAWAAPELRRLGVDARVVRKVQLWYGGRGVERYRHGEFPCFFVADGENYFYGFPAQEPWGLKLAEHNISHDVVGDPLELKRELVAGDQTPVLDFLSRFFPALEPQLNKYAACMYTLTPDEHFVLDIHPECPAVVLAAGFSGHGFKFATVVGEILAELALDGDTRQPIEFLRLGRFA